MSLIVDIQKGSEMPRGTRHVLTGTLRLARRGFELHMDGGCVWALDVPSWRPARRFLGQRVTVEGTRSGFDLLDVHRLHAMETLEVTDPWWWRLISNWRR
jgi:hypothetical protein